MKCEALLNNSGLNTENKLIIKCCKRNTIKKKPDSAIKTFLTTEETEVLFTLM